MDVEILKSFELPLDGQRLTVGEMKDRKQVRVSLQGGEQSVSVALNKQQFEAVCDLRFKFNFADGEVSHE